MRTPGEDRSNLRLTDEEWRVLQSTDALTVRARRGQMPLTIVATTSADDEDAERDGAGGEVAAGTDGADEEGDASDSSNDGDRRLRSEPTDPVRVFNDLGGSLCNRYECGIAA